MSSEMTGADNLEAAVERLEPCPLHVGQEIDLHGHRWTVKGIHLGALGQESLIHLEGLSHAPGWTGPWEFHPMLFVPEIMLSAAMALSSSNARAGELDAISAAIGTTEFMDPPDGGDVSLAEQVRRMKAAYDALNARAEAAEEALREIAGLEPQPFAFPEDWGEQVNACEDCQRYRGHPIQQGICDTHRRPIWRRDKHRSDEEKLLGCRAKSIARTTLASMKGADHD